MVENGFWAIVKRGFGSLLLFRGWDNRQQFWFFFLAILCPVIIGYFIASMAITMSAMLTMPAAHGAFDPKIFANMGRAMAQTAMLQSVLHLLVTLILASAVVRRLHDRGRSGFWYLIWPVAAINMGLVAQRQMNWMAENLPKYMQDFVNKPGTKPFENQAAIMSAMPHAGWPSVVLGLAMLWLLIQLLLPGTAGPNMSDEEP